MLILYFRSIKPKESESPPKAKDPNESMMHTAMNALKSNVDAHENIFLIDCLLIMVIIDALQL